MKETLGERCETGYYSLREVSSHSLDDFPSTVVDFLPHWYDVYVKVGSYFPRNKSHIPVRD